MTMAQADRGTALLLGNYRPTLVVARELKRSGFRIMSGLDGCDRGAELSRFVDEVFDHPSVVQDKASCLASIAKLLSQRSDITCVFPVSEEYVRLFAEARPVMPNHATVASVPAELVSTCLDKRQMMTLAQDHGVPIAQFAEVSGIDALNEQANTIGFPLVVRPADSTKRLAGEKAVTIADGTELAHHFARWPSGQKALLLQKKAKGIRHNFYFAAVSGEIRRSLHAIITRTDRIDGSGLAVDGVTVTPDADLARYTASLTQALAYSGVGCAQYLVDELSGEVSFLEINPRIAGNHAVPDYCGLELGLFLYDLCNGADVVSDPIRVGRAGVRYSWLAGDLNGLKSSLKRREIDAAGAWRWLKALVATMRASDLDMMLNRRDLLPGLATLADVIPGLGHLTRLRHRFHGPIFKRSTTITGEVRASSDRLRVKTR